MKKSYNWFFAFLLMVLFSLSACGQVKQSNTDSLNDKESNITESKEQNPNTIPSGNQDINTGEDITNENEIEQTEIPKDILPTEVVEITPEIPGIYYVYSDEMGRFNYNSKTGYLDTEGKVAIEPIYKTGTNFNEGYALAMTTDDNLVILDKQGNEVFISDKYTFDKNSPICLFSEGMAGVYSKIDNKYALINNKGEELFIMKKDGYIPLGTVSCGVIVWGVLNGNDILVTDSSGNEIFPPLETGFGANNIPKLEFVDNLLAVPNFDKTWNVIDKSGNKIMSEDFEELKQPSEGMIPYKKNHKWGYLDYQGNVVIEPQYNDAYNFSNGIASVIVDNKVGYIDLNNNMVIEPQFIVEARNKTTTYHTFDKNGFAIVPDNNGSVINMQGEIVLSPTGAANVFYTGDAMICFFDGSNCKVYKLK